MNLPGRHSGSSVDTVTKALGVEAPRATVGGIHGAKIDTKQAAQVVEVMRCCGKRIKPIKSET